jgi:DNA-binding transcriptional LysR family regulator
LTSFASQDNQIRLFVAVAKANSLREAAEVQGMAQPSLSKQIRALEDALGTRLFLRHGRGMKLTAEGQALFLKVEPLIAALDGAVVGASSKTSGNSGSLRISTIQTLVHAFIPAFSRELLVSHPHILLSMNCDSSANVVESIERDRAEVGFVYDSAVDAPDMVSVPLFEERLALYTRADSAVAADTLSQLASHKFILPPRSFAVRRTVETASGGAIRPFIECDSLELSLRLVSISDGVTVLPDTLPIDMVEARGLKRHALPGVAPRRVIALARARYAGTAMFDLAIDIATRVGSRKT